MTFVDLDLMEMCRQAIRPLCDPKSHALPETDSCQRQFCQGLTRQSDIVHVGPPSRTHTVQDP